MMKKILCGLILCSILFAACTKSDKCAYVDSTIIPPTGEIDSLRKVLTDSGIATSISPSGFFYKIFATGSGTGIANLCSNVTVNYKARFLGGHVFDSTGTGDVANFQLGQVIIGWQKGLPLISKGGDITLYLPPSLAYGPNVIKDSAGNVLIPANSYLSFDIHVVDIK
jgi:FKBP-type peptidyl-prolyl cis-trans isomerase FkpA